MVRSVLDTPLLIFCVFISECPKILNVLKIIWPNKIKALFSVTTKFVIFFSIMGCRTVKILATRPYLVQRLQDLVLNLFLTLVSVPLIIGRKPTYIKLYRGEFRSVLLNVFVVLHLPCTFILKLERLLNELNI